MKRLLDHELLVVAGKGGVGRTTATAALGLAAARLGRRTCIVELSGQEALARAVGFDRGAYEARRVTEGLDVRSMSLASCLADFGARKLRLPGLARWFFESRLTTGFVEAVPGLHDLVQLGKIEDMLHAPLEGEPAYDLVILDGPATGHGLTLLASARSMREMTVVGPFHDLAAIIERLLEDPVATGTVLVTLPEALPVNEGLQLVGALAHEHTSPAAVLVNQVSGTWPDALPPEDVLAALEPAEGAPAHVREVCDTLTAVAATEIRRHARQTEALADLAAKLPHQAGRHVPIHRLPVLEDPAPTSLATLEPLAERLAEVLA